MDLDLISAFFLLSLVLMIMQVCARIRPPFFKTLQGKHVVITGGSSGIGFAIAKKSMAEGAYVTLIARTSSKLQEAREALSKQFTDSDDRILVKAVDVSDQAAISASIREVFEWRPIDVLVCNAGSCPVGFVDTLTVDLIDETVRTNLMGTIYPVHAILPLMKQRSAENPSSIVFVSSLAGLFAAYGACIYAATKHAQRGLADSLRLELIPYNIRLNVICPGYTDTPILDEVDKKNDISTTMGTIFGYDRKKAVMPDYVADCTLRGIKKGTYIVTTHFGGFLISILARGPIPSDSIFMTFLDCALFFPCRLISIIFKSNIWRTILKDNMKNLKRE